MLGIARLELFRDVNSEHRVRFTRLYLWFIVVLTITTIGFLITDRIYYGATLTAQWHYRADIEFIDPLNV